MCFAMDSRSMVWGSLPEREMGGADSVESQPADGESESMLRVSGRLEPSLHEALDPLLRRRPPDGGHAGVPAGSDLDVGRQAGYVHQALGVGDRPLVER